MGTRNQWHPAFCSAAELEFGADREILDFYTEWNLSRKPLQMDQLIVTSKLSEEHAWLRVMTDKLNIKDAYRFVEISNELTEQGDKNNADAIMQVSVAANQFIYKAIREEDPKMCEALRELMKDDLDRATQEGISQGISQGIKQGARQGAIQGSIEAWLDVCLPREDILLRLQKKYSLDEETAVAYFEQFSAEAVV